MLDGRKEMGGGDRRSESGAVGGVVAEAKHSAGAGDAGADRAGQRGGRKPPGPCATAAAHRAHHLPVASSLREPGFGGLAQSATGWAAAAHHRGQRAGSRQRHAAQAQGRDPLECAAVGQRGWTVGGHRASHLAEVRAATPSGRDLQVQPRVRNSTANWPTSWGCMWTRPSEPWCCAWTRNRKFRRLTAPSECCRCGQDWPRA